MLPSRLIVLACSLLALPLVADAVQGQSAPKDLHGDPLPAGSVVRIGQDRWLHGITANFAAFLPDGKTVVTVNTDRTIRLWEFPSGKEIRRINLPVPDQSLTFSGQVDAALSNDGKIIASSERGG